MQDERQLSLSEIQRMIQTDYSSIRVKFIRPDEGIKMYRMSRSTLLKLSREAGALFKIGRMCLIEKDDFNAYLEKFKVPKGMLEYHTDPERKMELEAFKKRSYRWKEVKGGL